MTKKFVRDAQTLLNELLTLRRQAIEKILEYPQERDESNLPDLMKHILLVEEILADETRRYEELRGKRELKSQIGQSSPSTEGWS